MELSVNTELATMAASTALLASLILVPAVRALARRVGLVDQPDPTRKLHSGQIALAGGVAVLLATYIGAFGGAYFGEVSGEVALWTRRWTLLLLASLSIVLLGVVDDWVTLRGRQKLFGQMLVAAVLIGGGTIVRTVGIFGMSIELGVLAIPLTFAWLIGSINALNLIDGADGMASTVGAIVSGGLAVIAFASGHAMAGIVAASLSAALLGFLVFNRPPASIFLGDAGSMMIGLIVGVLAIWAPAKEATAIAALVPIAVLSIPLFDSTVAILRRVLTGRSLYAADRAHLHHVLLAYLKTRNLSPIWMLVIVGGLCLITTSGAVASTLYQSELPAILAIVTVLGGLVATRVFGYAEMRLLAGKTKRFGKSLVVPSRHCDEMIDRDEVSMQGSGEWDSVWLPLVEFAQDHGFRRLRLDISVAWMHEGYHGYWSKGRRADAVEQWSIKLPLMCGGRPIGSLDVQGAADEEGDNGQIEAFLHLVDGIMPELQRFIAVEKEKTLQTGAIADRSQLDPEGELLVAKP